MGQRRGFCGPLIGLAIWAFAASFALAAQDNPELERRVEAARDLSVSAQAEESMAAWSEVLASFESDSRPRDALYAEALHRRSAARFYNGDPDNARSEANEAIAVLEQLQIGGSALAEALVWRGTLGTLTGDLDGGRVDFERAETIMAGADPVTDPVMLDIQSGLTSLDRRAGDWEALAGRVERLLPGLASLEPGNFRRLSMRMELANAQTQLGLRSEALENYRLAYRESLAHRGPDNTFTVLAAESLGMFELTQGNDVEAARILAASLEQRRQGVGVPFELAAAKGMNGLSALALDRPAEAEALFLESRSEFATAIGPASRPVMITLRNAAAAASAQGDHVEAGEWLAEALAIAESLPGNTLMVAQIKAALAVEQALTGQTEAASASSETAGTMLAEMRPEGDTDRIQVEIIRAWVLARAGDLDAAKGKLRAALPYLEADLERRLAVGAAPAPPRDLRIALGRGLETAYLTGDIETGFRIAQLMIEGDASRAAVAAQFRLAQRDDDLADLLRRRQGLALQRQTLDRRYLQVVGAGDAAPINTAAEEIRANDAAFREVSATIGARHPLAETLIPALPLTLEAARSRLAPGEALVAPVLTPDAVLVFVLTPTQALWSRSHLAPGEVVDRVERLRGSVQTGSDVRDAVDALQPSTGRPATFDLAAGRDLRRGLLGGEVAEALAAQDTLIFATGRELSRVPWAALAGSDSSAAPDWLIETWAVQTAPSVRSLRADVRAERAPVRLFGIGAPNMAGSEGAGDVMTKTLAPLPGARRELEALGAAFPRTEILMDGDATKARLGEADLRSADILVFATHGLLAGDAQGLTEPALLMTAGAGEAQGSAYLTASEVALLDLDAAWVVLSACDTAAPGRPGAGGFTGLAQAFLFAGARRVMASHWPVRDDVSARMTLQVTREAAAGAAPAQALRAAMLSVLRDPTVGGGSDPAVWAPFALIGS